MSLLILLSLTGCWTDSSNLAAQVSRPYSGDIQSEEQCLRLAEKAKNSCLHKLALQETDPSHCDLISASTLKMKCKREVR